MINILKFVGITKPNYKVGVWTPCCPLPSPIYEMLGLLAIPCWRTANHLPQRLFSDSNIDAWTCIFKHIFQDLGASGTITLTQPSITVFSLSLTTHDTAITAMNCFSLFTSAEAKTTSPMYKGAGKLISWERNTHPGPGILVPRRAEISPLIKTPCTIVFPNLVHFAKSSFKCKGLTSPVNSEKATTSLCVKALLSSARSPTLMCVCWKCCLLPTGWFRQILLWSLTQQRRWLEITGNIFNTFNFHQQELLACFSLETLCWHQWVLLRAEEYFWNWGLFNPILVPYYYQIMQGEREKPVRQRKMLIQYQEKIALKHRVIQKHAQFLQDKASWCSGILMSILRGSLR